MNTEERLRAVLTDPRLALPAWPDPVTRVRLGVGRRRRRRATALAAAAAAVGVLALPVVLRMSLSDGPRPVGPASPAPSTSTPDAIRGTAAACAPADLSAVLVRGDELDRVTLAVTNTGTRRCTLDGWPTLVAVGDEAAQVIPVVPIPADAGTDHETPATIDPTEVAYATVVASTTCHGGRNAATYAQVALTVGEIRVPVGGPALVATCPIQIGPWYRRVGKD